MRCEFVDAPELLEHDGLLINGLFSETQVPLAMRDVAIQMANNDTVDAPSGHNKPPFGDIRLVITCSHVPSLFNNRFSNIISYNSIFIKICWNLTEFVELSACL